MLTQGTTVVGWFVRKWAVQGWRNVVTLAQLQLFEQYFGAELAEREYPSVLEAAAAHTQPQPVGG